MNYWLVKSEPGAYSWDQLVKDKKTSWDGIRNYAARIHLRAMKKGDLALFYHSNVGLEIVGVAEVTKSHYPDPTFTDDTWVSVEIKAKKALKKPVTLAQMKANPDLAELQLIRISRLSVSVVTKKEFEIIIEMGETKM